MAKTTAVVVTIIGLLLLFPLVGINLNAALNNWLIALGVLLIGVTKLMRNYGKKRR